MTSIEQRDPVGFIWMALAYIGVFAVSTLLAVCSGLRGTPRPALAPMAHAPLVLDYLGIATPYRLREAGRSTTPTSGSPTTCGCHHHTLSFVLMVLNGTITIIASGRALVDHAGCSRPWIRAAARCSRFGSGAHDRAQLLAIRPRGELRADLVHVRANAESWRSCAARRLRTRLLRRRALTANARA